MARRLRRDEYTVGWVCALPIELAAAQEMLDEEYERLEDRDTIYTLGRIGGYNVVLAGLPGGQTGTVSAAVIAGKMIAAFTSIRIGLMVGIGGGVPAEDADVRLGDVVISKPHNAHGGVVQYDFGKTTPDGFERTGSLNTPPAILLNAVTNLQANHIRGQYKLPHHFSKLNRLPVFARENAGSDILFEAKYKHEGGATCGKCSKDRVVSREPRRQEVVVHYGIIASGNKVMRDGTVRDRVSAQLGGVLCFEMEAAGLMNSFPCLVIRGICDYADSHKNKKWQAYAAGTAAACAKEVLSVIPLGEVAKARKAEFVVASHEFLPLLYENACIYEESKNRNRRRVPRTCEWFISHTLFQQWNTSSNSQSPGLLYVTADPGCGKSVLCRYLIDDILPKPGRTACFFFFKEDFEQQRSSLSALCSLLHQLFVSNRHLLTEDILERYTDRGKMFFQSFDDLWGTFLFAASHQDTVCVLDALDECRDKDRKQLIDAITAARNTGSSKMTKHCGPKFLLTSRPYEHIRAQFFLELKTPMASIHLQGDQGLVADEIAQEIQLVLDSRINETAEFFCLEPDERALMRTQLASVLNRTYLWITLVFDGLLDRKLGLSKSDIMSILRAPPPSVHDAYEKILNKSPDLENARRLLHIIIGAERPLSLAEMSIALAFKDNESAASVSERIIPNSRIKAYVRDLCGLFAIVVDHKVYLLHQTAREFLVHHNAEVASPQLQCNPSHLNQNDGTGTYIWRHSIAMADTNAVLAQICIWYLHSKVATEHSSFLEYAAIYWANHYRHSPDICQVEMAYITRHLCMRTEARSQWSNIYAKNAKDYTRTLKIIEYGSALCVASAMGLVEVVKLLLPKHYLSSICPVEKVGLKNSLSRPFSKVKQRFTMKLRREYREDVQEALLFAAKNGQEAVVKLLLCCTSADSKDNYGRTPLSYAAENGHLAIVKLLLQREANVKSKHTGFGWTPLWYATMNGHEAVVELLLQREVDVDSKDIDGMTLLSHAAMNGHEAVVKLLLQKKVKVDSTDGEGITPLWWAAAEGHHAIIKLLVETGQADVNCKNNNGVTPLSRAAALGHGAAVKVLLQVRRADVDATDIYCRTPLSYATINGCKAIVKLLLEDGRADVNLVDNYSRSPLSYTAEYGHTDIVSLLLETGQANVGSQDTLGRTPLSCAAINGRKAIVKLLLEDGRADVNLVDNYSRSPLSYTAEYGHTDIVSLLLETGQANVDLQDNFGRTPLLYAVSSGYKAIVKLLLEDGRADVNWVNEYGQSPLLYTAKNGYIDIVKLLLEDGRANVNLVDKYGQSPLSYATKNGHIDIISLLLETGQVNVDSQDTMGRTPLLYTAENGYIDIVKLLLEDRRADVNLVDKYGQSPLSYATENGYIDIVKLLLEDGRADVNLVDKHGRSPLSYAAKNGHIDIISLLLETGQANVDSQDTLGRTPLSYAAENGHEAVVKLLQSVISA